MLEFYFKDLGRAVLVHLAAAASRNQREQQRRQHRLDLLHGDLRSRIA
jgi:hypothetical protein